PRIECFLTGLREADCWERAQAHLTFDIVTETVLADLGLAGSESKNPRSVYRAVFFRSDLQIESAAVSEHQRGFAISAFARLGSSGFDFALRKSIELHVRTYV